MNIYLQIPDYLAQWLTHEQGGSLPVRLSRNSVEAAFLEQYLQKPPADYTPDLPGEGKLAIILPSFKSKPPEYYYHLPAKARVALVECIRNRFDLQLWNAIHKFSALFSRQDSLIEAFMEQHAIEDTPANFQAVQKRYQRKRDYYLSNFRHKKKRKNS